MIVKTSFHHPPSHAYSQRAGMSQAEDSGSDSSPDYPLALCDGIRMWGDSGRTGLWEGIRMPLSLSFSLSLFRWPPGVYEPGRVLGNIDAKRSGAVCTTQVDELSKTLSASSDHSHAVPEP